MTTDPDYYEASYSRFGIHKEMLEDVSRTTAYRNAILRNPHLFEGKTVLDVGCGTGILSLFAAKAGAKRVFAVEMSSMHEHAQRIVDQNGLGHIITVLHGSIEELELPVEHVDVIISEWMGYFLIFERMIDSVLFARDKWLAPGGVLFPDRAIMYIAGSEDADYVDEHFGFWDDVYGFDMSHIGQHVRKEPLVDAVRPDQLVTESAVLIEFDLYSCTVADLDFTAEVSLPVLRRDYMHAMVVWWDCRFEACHVPVTLSTSTQARLTHWKQSLLYLPRALAVSPGEQVDIKMEVTRHPRHTRCLDITAEYVHDGDHERIADRFDWFFG